MIYMSITYDRLRAADEHAAIAWWAAAYGDDPTIIMAAFRTDAQHRARSYAAQEADGTLAAAITYWVREIRDAAGVPRRAAHIWGVGTPADAADTARRQHVDQLMGWALNAARREDCALALCYPAPETYAHLVSRGWQLFPNGYRQGTFSGVQLPASAGYTIRSFDPTHEPDGWRRLAAVYQAYNATRPASVVRDVAYWRAYLGWRWGEWSGTSPLLVAAPLDSPDTLCGYIIPKYYHNDHTFLIAEIGVAPRAAAAVPMLVTGVLEEATRRKIVDRFRVYFPSDTQLDALVSQLFTPEPQVSAYGVHAAYPLVEMSPADLAAMFTAPGSHAWLLDQF